MSMFGSMQGTAGGESLGVVGGIAVGARFGGLPGAIIGGAVGGLAASGMFSSSSDPNNAGGAYYRWVQQMNQINDFEKQLQGIQNNYANSLTNYYQTAFNNFATNAIPYFAASGLQVNGGAFSAELGRQAAIGQSQLFPQLYQSEIGNAIGVESARQNAWAQYNGVMGQQDIGQGYLRQEQAMQNTSAVGNLAGSLTGAGMGAYGESIRNTHPILSNFLTSGMSGAMNQSMNYGYNPYGGYGRMGLMGIQQGGY